MASPHMPDLWLMLLFAVGSVVMRSAGCIVNDLYDRELDRKVERTANRPLASGEIKPWQALILLALLLLLGFGILLLLKPEAIVIGVASLILVFTYPLMKRITWWPQLFLGFTFNWGALVSWAAVVGVVASPALWLYAAGTVWTLAYDTIYAHQDKEDDEHAGIKSTARLFGKSSKKWVGRFYIVTILLLLCAGHAAGLGKSFYVLMIWAANFAYNQWSIWRTRDPLSCQQRFRGNRDFGLIVLLAIIIGKFI